MSSGGTATNIQNRVLSRAPFGYRGLCRDTTKGIGMAHLDIALISEMDIGTANIGGVDLIRIFLRDGDRANSASITVTPDHLVTLADQLRMVADEIAEGRMTFPPR